MKHLSERLLQSESETPIAQYAYLELFYRLDPRFKTIRELPKITGVDSAMKYLRSYIQSRHISLDCQEKFIVMFLNNRYRILAIRLIGIGIAHATLVDVKYIVKLALDCGAQHIIAFHNHPSYHMEPSQQDFKITQSLTDALKCFDISLVDHIIVASDLQSHYSMVSNN